jgi:hypothetical protein
MNPAVGVTEPISVASQEYRYHRLSPELADQLVSINRTMFPHDSIPDEFYEHIVRKLDEKAAQDPQLLRLLCDGVEVLHRQAGSPWRDLSEQAKLESLKRSEQTLFFQRLRSNFVADFYSNPAVWPRFGYEGPSNDKGGYLNRGFDDIDWIKKEDR